MEDWGSNNCLKMSIGFFPRLDSDSHFARSLRSLLRANLPPENSTHLSRSIVLKEL